MSDIDWHGVGLLLIGAWQFFKEARSQYQNKKAAKEVVRMAQDAGALATKLERDLAPVFAKAAKIGEAWRKKPPQPLPSDTLP